MPRESRNTAQGSDYYPCYCEPVQIVSTINGRAQTKWIGDAAVKYINGSVSKIKKLQRYHDKSDALHGKLSQLAYSMPMSDILPTAKVAKAEDKGAR